MPQFYNDYNQRMICAANDFKDYLSAEELVDSGHNHDCHDVCVTLASSYVFWYRKYSNSEATMGTKEPIFCAALTWLRRIERGACGANS